MVVRSQYFILNFPQLFQLSNPARSDKKTHCGVLEFTAEEGHVYLPYWVLIVLVCVMFKMMQLLLVEEGAFITVRSATLPKGILQCISH